MNRAMKFAITIHSPNIVKTETYGTGEGFDSSFEHAPFATVSMARDEAELNADLFFHSADELGAFVEKIQDLHVRFARATNQSGERRSAIMPLSDGTGNTNIPDIPF